ARRERGQVVEVELAGDRAEVDDLGVELPTGEVERPGPAGDGLPPCRAEADVDHDRRPVCGVQVDRHLLAEWGEWRVQILRATGPHLRLHQAEPSYTNCNCRTREWPGSRSYLARGAQCPLDDPPVSSRTLRCTIQRPAVLPPKGAAGHLDRQPRPPLRRGDPV